MAIIVESGAALLCFKHRGWVRKENVLPGPGQVFVPVGTGEDVWVVLSDLQSRRTKKCPECDYLSDEDGENLSIPNDEALYECRMHSKLYESKGKADACCGN